MAEPEYNEELTHLRSMSEALSALVLQIRSMDLAQAKREEWSFTQVYYPDRGARLVKSLLLLLPSETEAHSENHSDLPSVACLARALLETYLMFFYFCSDPSADREEIDLRRKIAILHLKREEAEVSKALAEPEDDQRARQDIVGGFRDANVAKHPALGKVPADMRKNVLKGRELTYIRKPDIAKEAGFEQGLFKAYYRVLSSLAHPHYFGAQHELRSGALGRDTEDGRVQVTVVLLLVNAVAAKLIGDILERFPGLTTSVDRGVLELVAQLKERFNWGAFPESSLL